MEHPVCAVATVDGERPPVRMFGMWFADKNGFYFSSAKVEAVYRQLTANPNAELCFYAPPGSPSREGRTIDIGKVLRASGVVAFLDDPKLKERLLEERLFLCPSLESITIFRVEKSDAWFWTFSDSGRESAIERIPF